MPRFIRARFVQTFALLLAVPSLAWAAAAPELEVVPVKSNAVYEVGEAIVWRVQPRGVSADAVTNASFVFKRGGATVVGSGTVTFTNGAATVQTSLAEPGSVLVEVSAKTAKGTLKGLGGAVADPTKIKPSAPAPDDFDAFWKTKLAELAAIPANPVLQEAPSGKTNVNYWKIDMDNIHGTKVRGQLARPAEGKKFPAMLLVQYAGVYGIPKENVTSYAADGWLTLNILAHDLPIDQPPSFYDQQNAGALKNYTAIGNEDREKSYFLRMFLACYRAAEYLSQRPDWDGRTLVVSGTSQGGLQAFVTAGLHPKVTAMMAMVPAGCDHTGARAGRRPGWPYWMSNVGKNDPQKVEETSRYFDGANFAARITCPALVGVGLIDTTSPASGVYGAFNAMRGPKEMVVMPLSDHRGKNNSQAPYRPRSAAWRKALLKGEAPPVK